jgi:hypothetical protein
MDCWGIPDEQALALIDYPGRMPSSGKRPRFRPTTKQAKRLAFLREIELNLQIIFGEARSWLVRRQRAAPFANRTPLERMIQDGMPGMEDVLHTLHKLALRG